MIKLNRVVRESVLIILIQYYRSVNHHNTSFPQNHLIPFYHWISFWSFIVKCHTILCLNNYEMLTVNRVVGGLFLILLIELFYFYIISPLVLTGQFYILTLFQYIIFTWWVWKYFLRLCLNNDVYVNSWGVHCHMCTIPFCTSQLYCSHYQG